MVVAQLVERSPSTPEICGSNPVKGQTFIERLLIVNRVEKTKIMKKRPGMAIFLQKMSMVAFKSKSQGTILKRNLSVNLCYKLTDRLKNFKSECVKNERRVSFSQKIIGSAPSVGSDTSMNLVLSTESL